MTRSSFQFGKQHRLKSRKQIEQLFAQGSSVSAHPLRLVYATPAQPQDTLLKIGVSVSSRNFKKAADRNRIKRLLREAYRLNQALLVEHCSTHGQLAAFILYTDKVMPEFSLINDKMQLLLKKLIKATGEAPPSDT